MSTKKIVLTILSAVAAALVVALACHGAGANARGFAVLPLAAGVGAAWLVVKKSGIQ